MARDNPELDGDESGLSGPERGEPSGSNSLIDRRSYLKLAGTTTAAGAAMVAGTAAAAASEEYEVIEADNSFYHLDDGEVFENKIIDFSNGNYFLLYARDATNWTIRNVGFRGTHRHDYHAMAVADAGGGSSTIENVYMGDGCVRPDSYSSHGQCAIWVAPEHSGHIEIKNCNIQDWPNNGIYASPPGYNGQGGTVHIDSCFAANNYVSSYRLSSNGSRCTNSVAYNDSNGRYNGRCFWGWNPGEMTVSNCDFSSGSYTNAIHLGRGGERTDVVIEDTQYDGISERGTVNIDFRGSNGSNADLSMPDGVPTSATEAASNGSTGGSGGTSRDRTRGDHEDLAHTYEFVAEGEDEPTDYYFEIEEGPIEPSTYNGASIDADLMWVSDDGTRAAGRVVDGRHAWEFDSLLVDATVEGPADAVVDDNPSNLDRYPQSGATGDDWKGDMPWHDGGFEHSYEFVAEGEDEPTDYYFEIEEGPIEPSTLNGASIEEELMWISDDGTRAAGRVVDGRHAWEFDTLLVDVTVEGPADALVDGRPSNLDRYPQPGATGDDWKGDMPWHEIEFEHSYELVAEGEDEPTDYYLEIEEGPIEPSTLNGASIEEELMWVSDDGTRAAGRVVDGRHAWEFDSLLVDVTVDGPADALVDGRTSHLSRYPQPGATGDDWKDAIDFESSLSLDGI